jgi:hypothetical protein
MTLILDNLVIIRSAGIGIIEPPTQVNYLVDEDGNYILDEDGHRITIDL